MTLDPFISRQDLSDRLGQDVTADDNARIAVDAACDVVRVLTEQEINYIADEIITLDGTGTDAVLLPELPVVEVSSVFVADEAVTDFTIHDNGVLLGAVPWALGRNNIEVTYSHGWSEVPSALRVVALNIAQRLFERGGDGGGVTSETLGAYSVSYQTTEDQGGGLTLYEEQILRRYKQTKQSWATLVAS